MEKISISSYFTFSTCYLVSLNAKNNVNQSNSRKCSAPVCLQCGEPSHHVEQSCREYLEQQKKLLEGEIAEAESATEEGGKTSWLWKTLTRTAKKTRSSKKNAEPELAILKKERISQLCYNLKYLKPCPACRVMIERSDGCNRVDCLYCEASFCWMCTQNWSEVILISIANIWMIDRNVAFIDVAYMGLNWIK